MPAFNVLEVKVGKLEEDLQDENFSYDQKMKAYYHILSNPSF